MPRNRSRQLPANLPLYIRPGKTLIVQLQFDERYRPRYVKGSADKASQVLMEYASWHTSMQYTMWAAPPSPDSLNIRCMEFLSRAGQLMKQHKLPDLVKRYLLIWSYAAYLDALSSFGKRNATWSAGTGKADIGIPINIWRDTDDSLSVFFPNLRTYMLKLMNDGPGSKSRSIQNLQQICETICENIQDRFWKQHLLGSVLSSYIENDYHPASATEDAKAMFVNLVNTYAAEEKREGLLQFLSSRSYAVPGAAAPDIAFKDVTGNPVKLDRFRDSLVYIDLWASWCVPCIKEIPALQAMEAKFKGRKIVFLSISLDERKQAWKDKLKELDLHGNQWEVGDSGFDQMMNIRSIPRFLLYGPDGKLITANAPRPSSAELEKLLEAHLGK